jgi:hypothetical protein
MTIREHKKYIGMTESRVIMQVDNSPFVTIVIIVGTFVWSVFGQVVEAQPAAENQPDVTPLQSNMEPEPPLAYLKVIKILNNTYEGALVGFLPRPTDFEIGLFVFQEGPMYKRMTEFPGSEQGWTLTFRENTQYNIKESRNQWSGYLDTYSKDCQGFIRLGENKTCIVTNTYIPLDPALLSSFTLRGDENSTQIGGNQT